MTTGESNVIAAAAIVLVALVADDPAVLRNAPRDDAPAQATLWRGDWLEVRGETAGFLRVYDHRHERPGYIRPTLVRVHRLEAASTPELAAIVRFLRDANGSESLGIGYAALALRAAPAGADTSEILAAIGTMADRLARRASAVRADARNATLTAHIEVAESYGVKFKSVDVAATGNAVGAGAPRARLCYDGEAWESVLARPQRGADRAGARRAVRGGTRLPGPDDAGAGADRSAGLERSPHPGAAVDRVSGRERALAGRAREAAPPPGRGATPGGPSTRPAAEIWSRPRAPKAAAVRELALTDRGVLAPEDADLYEEVAIRVAASRWATEAEQKPVGKRAVDVAFEPRDAGETCVRVVQTAARREDADPRRAVHVRARLEERAALGALRKRGDASPCSRWPPGPRSGCCGAEATAPGRSRR